MMMAALRGSSMDTLAVVEFFTNMKNEDRLQVCNIGMHVLLFGLKPRTPYKQIVRYFYKPILKPINFSLMQIILGAHEVVMKQTTPSKCKYFLPLSTPHTSLFWDAYSTVYVLTPLHTLGSLFRLVNFSLVRKRRCHAQPRP